jgi:hypothetical protein
MWFEYRVGYSGWAEAGIGDEAGHTTLTASYIGDALGDLLYALWRVLQGETETRCSWHEEPGEFRWIIRRDGDTVWLRVLEFDDLFQHRPDEAGQLVFETRQDVKTLARAIALGASRTLEKHGLSGYRERWQTYPFPSTTLELIQAELRA